MNKPEYSLSTGLVRWFAPGQLALLAAGLIPVLVVLSWLLHMAHNGLDLTDEGFYLNNISNPWLYSSSVTQFGFVYHPLLQVLGEDLVWLRQASMLISYGLSLGVAGLLLSTLTLARTWNRTNKLLLAALLAMPAWLNLVLTDFWMPTPSYNSLTFQAFLITVAFTLNIVRSKGGTHLFSWLVIGLGGALCFLAKPSSAAALGVVVLAYLYSESAISWRGLLLATMSATVLLILSSLVTDGSPLGLFHRFKTGYDDLQILFGSRNVVMFRIDDVWDSPQLRIGFLSTVLLIALSTMVRNEVSWVLSGILLALGGWIAIGVYTPSVRFFRFHGLLLLAVPLGVAIGRITLWLRNAGQLPIGSELRAGLFFLSLPFAYAFGSSNNYWMTGIGVAFFWALAGAVLMQTLPQERMTSLISLLACTVFALSGISLFLSMKQPYRQLVPLAANKQPIHFHTGVNPLRVSAPLADYLNQLKTQASASGFEPGMPMIDLTGHRPTVLYWLGAKAIARPWFLGRYAGSAAFAHRGLRQAACLDVLNAWVLIELDGPRSVNPVVLSDHYGLELDRDYYEAGRASLRHSYGSGRKKEFTTVLLKPKPRTSMLLNQCLSNKAKR